MKNVDLEDAGDLFDSTSGSGEEYIPDSAGESDTGSDKLNIHPNDSQDDLTSNFSSSEIAVESESTSVKFATDSSGN